MNENSLPTVVSYFPAKNMYSVMIGTYTEENLNDFLNSAIKGKLPIRDANKMRIDLKDCNLIKEEEVVEDEEDEILKEMREEMRKKEEEEAAKKPKKKKQKKKKQRDEL